MENINMKTGLDLFNNDDNIEQSNLDILSLLTVFMENSLSNAAIYTKHSNRTIITSKDISLSLKREVFEFLNSDNLENRAKQILDEYIEEFVNLDNIEDFDSDNEEDYEEDDEEDDEENDDNYSDDNNNNNKDDKKSKKNIDNNYITEETEEFVESICNCNICNEINKYKILWKDWKPSNKIEEILYNGIIKIDNDFNIN